MIAYLYIITRTETGQRYIGITINHRKRWSSHKWLAKTGRTEQLVHRAIAKYGADSFTFEVVGCARSWADACQAEAHLIEQYGSHVSLGGYNLTLGGEGPAGRTCSPETKARISASRKGQPGRPIPPEEREATRIRLLQLYADDPSQRSLRASRSIESRNRNGNTGHGRKNSPETIERMRLAALKVWRDRKA
jgi:group I intron endonuclease